MSSPFSTAFCAIRSTLRPAPSSATSTATWPPSWYARSVSVPSAALPAAIRRSRLLDAVVDRVAHQVGQRVLDRLEQAAVELGLLALHDQLDLLAERVAQVPDDPGQLRPDVLDRLHPGLHDALLQLAGDHAEPLGAADQRRRRRVSITPRTSWLRARTSSPTMFISVSSRSTSTRMALSAMLRLGACACSASLTAAGCALPSSSRIVPSLRSSPSICCCSAEPTSDGLAAPDSTRISPSGRRWSSTGSGAGRAGVSSSGSGASAAPRPRRARRPAAAGAAGVGVHLGVDLRR